MGFAKLVKKSMVLRTVFKKLLSIIRYSINLSERWNISKNFKRGSLFSLIDN